ncbi:MAG: GntR family transcriptional regulator [Henriciella sp.]
MRSLPKSVQLSEMLIREIASGRLPDGARLPTERDMAMQHNVAVGTVRKALSILEDKALLRRVQGSGNYVCAQTSVDSVYSFFRLELLAGGGLPTANILALDRLTRPAEAKAFRSRFGHRIRRERYLDGIAVAIEEIWLDGAFAGRIERDALFESLYYFYKQSFGLIIARIEDRIGVSRLPDWADDTLGVSKIDSCGFIERFGYDQQNRMSEYSRTWFDPSLAHYVNRLI